MLRLGTVADLAEIARRIGTSNTSISPADRAELAWLVENGHLPLPKRIPNKENLALVGSLLLASALGPDRALEAATVESLAPLFATATDVLRLAVAMSEGDVSLATPTRFRGFTRPERRALLALLEGCSAGRLEDMQRWGERWRRLGEQLHPGELAGGFPESARAFQRLRADDRVRSFNSRLERAFRSGEVADAVELLGQRPGEFARRLDQLLRLAGGRSDLVLESFAPAAARVSTPVLLQVAAHFRGRG